MTEPRRAWIATLAALITMSLAAVPAVAAPQRQQARRLKAIEAFEQLLTDTIHEHVEQAASLFAQAARLPEGAEPGSSGISQPLIRVGATASAHGVYIDGYGIIFSVQRPPVGIVPRAFERRFAEPWTLLRIPETDDLDRGRFMALSVIDFRTRQIAESLSELELLLEQELAQGADAKVIEARQAQIAAVRQSLAAIQDDRKQPADDSADVTIVLGSGADSDQDAEAGDDYLRAARARWSEYRSAIEQQRRFTAVLGESDQQIDAAVNEAALETLSQFGSMINWLDDDERVSVLVFAPPQYRFGPHSEARPDSEEYILSARYKDIRELGSGKLDEAKFRDRVRIHDRLGAEIHLREPEQR